MSAATPHSGEFDGDGTVIRMERTLQSVGARSTTQFRYENARTAQSAGDGRALMSGALPPNVERAVTAALAVNRGQAPEDAIAAAMAERTW